MLSNEDGKLVKRVTCRDDFSSSSVNTMMQRTANKNAAGLRRICGIVLVCPQFPYRGNDMTVAGCFLSSILTPFACDINQSAKI